MKHQTEGDRLALLTKAVGQLLLDAHFGAKHGAETVSQCRRNPCRVTFPFWNASRWTTISEEEQEYLHSRDLKWEPEDGDQAEVVRSREDEAPG